MDKITEEILRRRMHGLYLSRSCEDITQLSKELLGLHCWFHRNVVFSALIRGASLRGWKNALIKIWLYRGTLHGVAFEDLPTLLALNMGKYDFTWLKGNLSDTQLQDIADRVISLMEDGIYSRAEMRKIFAYDFDEDTIGRLFSPWGGIFVYLAQMGKVAFRDMKSRDFDLISAEPQQSSDEVLPGIFRRYIKAYGPATLADAAWFLGLLRDRKKKLSELNLDEYSVLNYQGDSYYYIEDEEGMGDIPELTLLSGFDPLIESYTQRSAVLPPEYKSAVILKSGICLPTVAVNGQVAGIWNIKKGEPVLQFFTSQPKRIENAAFELVDDIRQRTAGFI